MVKIELRKSCNKNIKKRAGRSLIGKHNFRSQRSPIAAYTG